MVSTGLLLFVALMATEAGRVHENGTGAMWVAPELVANAHTFQHCSQAASMPKPDLVFETLDPEDMQDDLPWQLSSEARELVNFEWHPDTGELSFNTHATTAVFSELAPASSASAVADLSCGSR